MSTTVKIVGGYLEVDMGASGQPPLGIWGGRPPNYVDIGGPPPQPGIGGGPGSLPPWVMPPIHYPPSGGGGQPPGIWGGANEPFPTPPIYIQPPGAPIPPGAPPWVSHPIPPTVWPEPPVEGVTPTMIEWKSGWSQATGWVVIGIPQAPHPTPSA
jgi:hypothetical protein